jgi:6-phosphofructokinase
MMKIGLLTGGGDVPGLNSVIASAQAEAGLARVSLLGFIKGWEGVLKNEFVDLTSSSVDPSIGGSILKSSRVNIKKIKNGPEVIQGRLKENGLEGLIVIGGEDTLSNAFSLPDFPQVLIAKTIDNDVGRIDSKGGPADEVRILNHFTIGFPTAAEKISSFVSLRNGLRTTAYSHERIMIVEAMGMHTGWLALAAAMGGADFMVIPEFPLDYGDFRDRLMQKYQEQKNVIAVISEGALWSEGGYVHAEKDGIEEFEHPRFGGAAEALGARLKQDLAGCLPTRYLNSLNPSYLYRSGAPNALDRECASSLGARAVRDLAAGLPHPVFLSIQKREGNYEIESVPLNKFASMADLHRFVDDRFYNPREYQVSEFGRNYLSSIIPEIPPDEAYLKFLRSKI